MLTSLITMKTRFYFDFILFFRILNSFLIRKGFIINILYSRDLSTDKEFPIINNEA